jgi:hypothetical protein
METKGRVKGYVLGQDYAEGIPTWKVRVTDESSPFVGDKLFVASVHDEIALANGLEVTFLIGAFTGRGKETYHKALDVAPPVVIPKCDFCDHIAEIGIEVSGYNERGQVDEGGATEYIRCCIADVFQGVRQGQTSRIVSGKTKHFRCTNFSAKEQGWRKMNSIY